MKNIQHIRQWMGIAGFSIVIMIAFVLAIGIIYFATGMGSPPHAEIEATAHDNAIILIVRDGQIPAKDWEYLVFDESVNPPTIWTPAPVDIKPGENIVLASGLSPATYRVQIRHKPTTKFIFEAKITI